MIHTLMALKISPVDILPLLNMIKDNASDRRQIEKLVLEYYKKTSKSITSPHHNPLRTRVVHSLRNLQLLQDQGSDIKLTPEGMHLCHFSTNPGIYKKELAKMLLHIDRETCHIIDLIKAMNNNARYRDIVCKLENTGITVKKSDDKLRRWLQFLTYCEILQYAPPLYRLNSGVIEALESESQTISPAQFEEILYEEYDKIKKTQGLYVSIPAIKQAVSDRLKAKGFFPSEFQDRLLTTIQKGSSRKIVLSETGVRQAGGIFDGKIYYYFIFIG